MTKEVPKDYSEDEIAGRRDEVVRRMANTPPQPRKAKNPPARRGKKKSTGAGQKKARDRGKS